MSNLDELRKGKQSVLSFNFNDAVIRLLTLNGANLEFTSHYDRRAFKLPISSLKGGANQLMVNFQRPYGQARGLTKYIDPIDARVYLHTWPSPDAIADICRTLAEVNCVRNCN